MVKFTFLSKNPDSDLKKEEDVIWIIDDSGNKWCPPRVIQTMNNRLVTLVAGLCLGGACSSLTVSAEPNGEKLFSNYVDAKGDITLPEGYRENWSHLGSWTVQEGEAKGIHDVYTERESVRAYLETGKWPDATTLVKEIRSLESGAKTTGVAQWAGKTIQWFVMVKDSQNRFPKNELWGDGWGWALFKPDNTKKQLAKSYQADCMACHVPAAATDRVFIEGYPTLIKQLENTQK